MRITTTEKLMNHLADCDLLDIYTELESGKVPSTSYAHDFCRRVNRMIDDGEISVKQDGFRHIYLPSLRKLVYKEMARRYFCHLTYYKDGVSNSAPDVGDIEDEEDVCKCNRCNSDCYTSDLRITDMGWLCNKCIEDLQSRDEPVTVYK